MTRRFFFGLPAAAFAQPTGRRTAASISGEQFRINGKPTYEGRAYNGLKIEGLLLNCRTVQGIFDDRNPETCKQWVYPDTQKWDPDRNTNEFVAAMPEWRKNGLLSFTVNVQGGMPIGKVKSQPWISSGIEADGRLKPAYMARLAKILDKADDLGMVPIVGVFYFGQDEHVRDEEAVKTAVKNTVNWILDRGYRNVLLEVNNECNVKSYDHAILKPDRVHELIDMAKGIRRNGQRLLVSTSYGGGAVPKPNVVKSADFLLMHGNGVQDPARITEMVNQARKVEGYRPMPILFNEDDHFDFEKPANNMMAAIGAYASWGYYDQGTSDYQNGYQSPPVNWRINTERKKAFFAKVKEVSGS